ncbi:hypothetical protein PIB30_067412 [Stylosanthes scabra]|uniref:Uncharacterized protein n=1 Tax=Stylosanthes scabra TaxID=79078 RepID=A0ABU6WQG2_9FABA|nr:hypothetical protein [Stylosanthes scabra]
MEERWGNWLKADQIGWRIAEKKANINPNMPKLEKSLKENSHKPIPVNLLKDFGRLSMQEKSGQSASGDCLSTGRNGGARNGENSSASGCPNQPRLQFNSKSDDEVCSKENLGLNHAVKNSLEMHAELEAIVKTGFKFGQHSMNSQKHRSVKLKQLARRSGGSDSRISGEKRNLEGGITEEWRRNNACWLIFLN